MAHHLSFHHFYFKSRLIDLIYLHYLKHDLKKNKIQYWDVNYDFSSSESN